VSLFELRNDLPRIDRLRQKYGWMIGAVLIIVALTGLIIAFSSVRPPRPLVLVILAFGLGLGSLLAVPSVPGIVRALQRLATASPPAGLLVRTPSGR
jgi:hydrogenase/urease accessory protein HupE